MKEFKRDFCEMGRSPNNILFAGACMWLSGTLFGGRRLSCCLRDEEIGEWHP
jgi:hypothetical protein